MRQGFLRFSDLDQKAVHTIIELARELEKAFRARTMPQFLSGKRIALSFEDNGFRNRVAFELGIRAMGGEAVFIPGRPGEKEPASDIARFLSNWFDAIVVRTPEFSIIEEIARAASVPVINARTGHNHPCEILGDLAFVQSLRGSLDQLRVVFVGEATNLCHSWFEAGATLPIEVIQVCPRGYEVSNEFLKPTEINPVGRLHVTEDLEDAVRVADVIYTDCWPRRPSVQESEVVVHAFSPFRITEELLEKSPASCIFLPCPPVTRGEEVSEDAMANTRCRVFEAKGYLVHAQNALLKWLIVP